MPPGELDESIGAYNFKRISDVGDVAGVGNSGAGIMQEPDSSQGVASLWVDNGVGLNSLSQADRFALDSRPLSIVTQYLPGSSEPEASSMGSVAYSGIATKDLETVNSLVGRDLLSEYHVFESNTLQTVFESGALQTETDQFVGEDGSLFAFSLGSQTGAESSTEQPLDLLQEVSRTLMIDNSAAMEPLASRESFGIIPVSEHIYVGVAAEALGLDTPELPDYPPHGLFDGTALKMSGRIKREASSGGSSRRILDQSDLDQYCIGPSEN